MAMTRNLSRLAAETFDVLVIGGGIYGASLAWEAASRGLSVALLEQADFASATSANSLKTIHGGFRYLQNADFGRMRESMQERKALMRIAPHLVQPLPVLVPARGHGMKGREAFLAAVAINDLMSADRNQGMPADKRIPGGKVVSREETLQILPGLPAKKTSGGVIFYDAQVYNSERLVLAFVQSAAKAGAAVANYIRADKLLQQDGRIFGVRAADTLSGEEFGVRAAVIANTTGPWAGNWLAEDRKRPLHWTKAVNLVTRQIVPGYCVGLIGDKAIQQDSLQRKLTGMLFVAPWRGRSLVGTSYVPYNQPPGSLRLEEADVADLLAGINRAYPPAELALEDVVFAHAGLLPARDASEPVKLTTHPRIEASGNLLSVVGVKYTTARSVARQAVDRIFDMLDRQPAASISAETPLEGGDTGPFAAFLSDLLERRPCGLESDLLEDLARNYGSHAEKVLRHFDRTGPQGERLDDAQALLRAQTIYAAREEMAQTVSDVIFRRSGAGSAGHPGETALALCARVLAAELGWDVARAAREQAAAEAAFPFPPRSRA